MRFLLILMALYALPATAADNAQFRSWAAFSYDETGTTTCYAVAKSGEALLYITHRPTEKSLNVFQYIPGFEIKLGSTAVLTIDSSQFTLFTTDKAAWARGSENDRAITEAITKGKKLTLRATRADGKDISISFSLAGSGLALKAINKMCGI